MSDNVSAVFERGKTYHWKTSKTLDTSYGTSVGLEGHIARFPDETVSSGGVKRKRTDRMQTCIIVRNVSPAAGGHDGAGALLPGRLCMWSTGYVGKRVDGGTCVSPPVNAVALTSRVAGVVDERLPAAGVPRYDLFWLQVQGPCLVRNALSEVADFSEGDFLCALTAATSGATTAGRMQKLVVASTNAVTVHEQKLGVFGRAISACTSDGTNEQVLVDLDIMQY